MYENFIFSVNAILPIFITVLIGILLKRFSSLPDAFYTGSEKFVFRIGLPCMLFLDVASASAESVSSRIPLVLFCVVGTLALCLILCFTVPVFVKDRAKAGAMVQGMFRSNFAILGIPLAISMFGDACRPVVASLLPFVIITYNVLAVLVLTVFSPSEKRKKPSELVKSILVEIAKNPLITGIVLALPFMLSGTKVPTVAEKVVDGFSDTVTALSLVSIGAGFDFSSVKRNVGNALFASLAKTVFVPLIMLSIAVSMGFRGVELGLVFIVFGSPVAVGSYIMAKNMHSDHSLAAQILLLSTLISLGTLFCGMFLLKSFNFI